MKRCMGCMELHDERYSVCPHCGFVLETEEVEAIHIQPGTVLRDRYVIGKVLGYGGFGATYIGWDKKLEQKVAVKEYLPNEFSTRMLGQTRVTVFNGEKAEQFSDGKKKFIDEAKRLAKFQNEEGIVKIFDSFEENETAYIIMEYLDGETLTSYLERTGTMSEDDAVFILMPVMNSLKVIHKAGLLHRDIAPDNIFITKDGDVKLIDFGAARFATTSHSRSLTVIIKPGYSPEEQYRNRGDQGTHTDVYALSATLYRMITGITPPDAMERRTKYENQNKDILKAPHKTVKNLSQNCEIAILNALNVRISDRTPDIETFMSELTSDKPVKRRQGKIKKIDVYTWPVWVKIALPVLAAVILVFGFVLGSGLLSQRNFESGLVKMPDVKGKDFKVAQQVLKEKGFNSVETKSHTVEYGETHNTIYYQNPEGGQKILKTTKITLTYAVVDLNSVFEAVSNGNISSEEIEELLEHRNLDDVIESLEFLEYTVDDVIPQHNNDYDKGQVFKVEINEDEKTAIIYVSEGPEETDMIYVVGLDYEEAYEKLEDLGLVVYLEYEANDDYEENTVISQSIEEDESVKRGDEITLTVATKEPTVIVPDVTGMSKSEAKDKLEALGFKVKDTYDYNIEVSKDNVIKTENAGTEQEVGSTVTIVVSQGPKTVKVTYDNGNGNSQVIVEQIVGQKYKNFPDPDDVTGKKFEGWYYDGKKITDETIVEFEGDHTVKARYSDKDAFTVTLADKETRKPLDTNPNTIPNKKYNERYYIPDISKEGYTIDHWENDAGETVGRYDYIKTDEAHTLYAVWKPIEYTVKYDAKGGSGAPSSQTKTHGTTLTLSSTVPTRTGYTFLGWSTSSTATSATYSAGGSFTTNANTTLYAVWKVNTYTVTFNANGGSGAPASQTKTYGTTLTLSSTVPTRTGYTFLGWSTSSTATSATYSAGGSFTTNANTTLYAVWRANTYTVTYNANGGTGAPASQTKTYGTTLTLSRTKPTLTGYTFLGWSTSSTATSATYQPGGSFTTNTNTTLYAVWRANTYTYTVKYESTNGTDLGSDTVRGTYDETKTISAKDISGYVTPSAQNVKYDAESKTITFKYKPEKVETSQKVEEGKWWYYESTGPNCIKYYVTLEYQNRKADSVQVRVVWTNELVLNHYEFGQYFNVDVIGDKGGLAKDNNYTIVEPRFWINGHGNEKTKTQPSKWIEVPLKTTDATSLTVKGVYWRDGRADEPQKYEYKIEIPAY